MVINSQVLSLSSLKYPGLEQVLVEASWKRDEEGMGPAQIQVRGYS